jgi:hypothetical protein
VNPLIVGEFITMGVGLLKTWFSGAADDRIQAETAMAAAVSAMKGDRETTQAAHDARVAASDKAIADAEKG